MTARHRIVAEARSWLGTPFQHQARLKGVGVDCIQLCIGVGEATGVLSVDAAVYRRFQGYGRQPSPRRMGEALAMHCRRIEPADVLIGDMAWLEWRDELPMHLAIIGEADGADGPRRTLIHAYARVGRVVEHGLVAEWPDRISSYWRYPGLIDG